ncbi:outer membrane protein [Oricola cellulosilytica]|uniref:Porin family protein n=1 Tax=Oricola cellulosilytica TaxID=1429082 RepID=A0A4R0PD70_9HYPH|nr:outer membrane protein [Oricola cellulosilytica]TCD15430.1 porin family protein [Oricola cellulosilytica]
MKFAAQNILLGTAALVASAIPALAADVYEPPIIEAPVFEAPEHVPGEVSGWYLRGDIGYAWNDFRGADYYTFPGGVVAGSNSLAGDLKGSFTYGAGVGYQINSYLRSDVTIDWFETDFEGSTRGSCGVATDCISTDVATASALALMVNAYVDLGTYGRFTPYVGAGFGGAHVDWGNLTNTACDAANPSSCDPSVSHWGNAEWRFAYAVMAGVSVDVSCRVAADLGYRFRRIEGGSPFGYAAGTGPVYDKGIDSHEIRAGVRYKFGNCAEPTQVVFQPEPLPVYK